MPDMISTRETTYQPKATSNGAHKKLVKFVKLDKEHKDLVHHMKYFHGNISNYVCPYCDKKFQARKLLYNQMQSIHLVKKTNCPERIKDISVNYVSK